MTAIPMVLACLCQVLLVGGQLFIKRATLAWDAVPRARARSVSRLAAGLALLTVWFFLWVGLMQTWNISVIYPFEGLGPVLLVLAARVILGEKLRAAGWIGVGLIGTGIMFVAGS